MNSTTVQIKEFSVRNAARATITSGAVGIIAAACLFSAVFAGMSGPAMLRVRIHDVGVITQFLLIIPMVIAFYKITQQTGQAMSRTLMLTGIAALCFTALFLLLGFVRIIADILYMFPQGIFGTWLLITCWRFASILPRWLRWFGMIVGFGLVLVGIMPVGYAILVDTIILRIPAASEEEVGQVPITGANMALHYFLWIGSFMGVLTLPFWTIFAGRSLLKNKFHQ